MANATFAGIGLLVVSLVLTFDTASGSPPTTTVSGHGYPYKDGAPILALKLTRMEMLSSSVGVGVAPIVTYSGGLVRAYLVRTNDAGENWTVTGDFPKGFYPWTTAFVSPREGYVINGANTLFTDDAGRTWSKVSTSSSPLAITVDGGIVWIPVESCSGGAVNGPCGTRLDTFRIGQLKPIEVSSVPTDQPLIAQVGPVAGYAIGVNNTDGKVYYTTDSGVTWSTVKSPCDNHQVTGGSVTSATRLFTYCEISSSSGSISSAYLFKTGNGGMTWTRLSAVQGIGLDSAVGSSGQFLWGFDSASTLSESSDGGRVWVEVPGIKYGTNGAISTFGPHEAWHVVTGHGIYRTLNGKTWKLLK
jgi:photosystem II stability/assembly factor-like uncharacterized protein